MKQIPEELLEQLLEGYEKPEDLLGSVPELADLPGAFISGSACRFSRSPPLSPCSGLTKDSSDVGPTLRNRRPLVGGGPRRRRTRLPPSRGEVRVVPRWSAHRHRRSPGLRCWRPCSCCRPGLPCVRGGFRSPRRSDCRRSGPRLLGVTRRAQIPRLRAAPEPFRPLNNLAHAAADQPRDARAGVSLCVGAAAGGGAGRRHDAVRERRVGNLAARNSRSHGRQSCGWT